MPWYGGRRAELREAAHDNDRQARVCRSCPCTCARCTGSAEPNRAGVKAPVLREESFREPVPTQSRFGDKRRSDHVHIREGDKLHSRRRDRGKARELPSGRCQRQGKSLGAIAEEIPSCQDMVLVEGVIDLNKRAAQVVKGGRDDRSVRTTPTGKIGCRPRVSCQQARNHRVTCLARTERTIGSGAHRYASKRNNAHPLALAFVISKEECLVLYNRAAQRAAELVIVKGRLRLPDGIKGGASIESVVPEILKCCAVH